MTDRNVTRLHPDPPASLPENDLSRRVALQQAAVSLLDHEPKLVDSDDTRMALLQERVGEVGAAYWRGHVDIDVELLKVWATAQAWLEHIECERAR